MVFTPSRVPGPTARRVAAWFATHLRRPCRRAPDFVVGGPERPYLQRWYLVPRNRFFNVYLHRFLRSDDDRALHDHMYVSASLLLHGHYVEHTIAAGGIHQRRRFEAGSLIFRRPETPHRIEIEPGTECWTLFVTGPRVRAWGFHCAERGWVRHEDFTDPADRGGVGKGCGE